MLKDSEVSWIGKIPEHWCVKRLLHCLRCKICDGPHETPDYVKEGIPFVSVDSLNDSKTVDLNVVKKFITDSDYKRYYSKVKLEPNDILFTKAATIGKTAIMNDEKFMIWSSIAVLKANSKIIDYEYLYYVVSCSKFKREAEMCGNINTQANVGMRDLEKIDIPIPPIEEQNKIVAHLNKICDKVEIIETDITKQINNLENYKRSTIMETTVHGLYKNVKMKNSGLSWNKKVPEHWKILPLKYLFKIKAGSTPKTAVKEYWNGDIPWVTPADYKTHDVYVSHGRRYITYLGLMSCSTSIIPENSIIFSKRAPIGTVAINTQPLCTNQGCLACTPINGNNTKYYYYIISILKEQFEAHSAGTTFKEISATTFKNFMIQNPPVEEQEEIVEYLDKKCEEIDSIIETKKQQIETLEEYKKSIIYEYVTGKRTV